MTTQKTISDFLSQEYKEFAMYSIEGRAKFRGETIGVDYAEAFVVVKKIEI